MTSRTLRYTARRGVRRGGLAAAATGAVLAAVLPLAVAGPAAADAGSPTGGGTGGGTVVQTGGVPTLINGSSVPAELHFDATLPAGTTGEVHARLNLPDTQFPPGGNDPWRTAGGLGTAQCSANGSAYAPCPWSAPSQGEPEVGDILLNLPAVAAAPTLHYDVKVYAVADFLNRDQDITGAVELTSAADGSALATGALAMHFHRVPAPREETALYAVDRSGVLWQYRGTANAAVPFQPRRSIGGGWQVYDTIAKVDVADAAGNGDLVARDRSGVLWYYKGTGDADHPFAPRVRVGGGWGQYTAITGGGWPVRFHQMLVARDASGHLWTYLETHDRTRPFAPRVLAGHGWNVYDPLTHYANGVMGRDSAGVLWTYDAYWGTASQPYAPRQRVGGGWQVYDLVTGAGDTDLDYVNDLVARDAAGRLWLYRGTAKPNVLTARSLVGGGWQIYPRIF